MLERNQLKTEGIRFARTLQLVFKTVTMFSASHTASQTPVQTSFNLLNELVKSARQFTIGFVDNRVLINNVLTAERSLQSLETDFLKRGIGAVTFEAGITLVGYKRLVTVLCAPAKEIDAQGGLSAYLEANPIEFARVFPAGKNQVRNEAGDTIVEDSESYLMSKALSEAGNPAMDRVDWFVQHAGLAPATGSSADDGGGFGIGSGTGSGTGSGSGGSGYGGGGDSGSGFGTGSGTGSGGRRSPVVQSVLPSAAESVSPGGVESLGAIVGNYFTGIASPEDNPQRSVFELARLIQEARPEYVLQHFPAHRREELRKLPPEQMAAEVIEDTAVKWAAERLTSAPAGTHDALVVEDEVVRVLLRSLQATSMAERLGRKLADYLKDLQVPQSTCARIQEELDWVVLHQREKVRRLVAIAHYSRAEFRRLINLFHELVKAGETAEIEKLASHYFAILELTVPPEPDEMGRTPELVQAIGTLNPQFWNATAGRLCAALDNWPDQKFLHQQLLNAITAVSRTLALFEEFELIERIGKSLEALVAGNPAEHSICCQSAMAGLLTQSAVDRIVELFIQNKGDHNHMRTAVGLLRRAGNQGLVRVFQYLEDENSTASRLALLRLIGRIGPAALELARERINDSRWYVVRNACKLLSDLKDPELLTHIQPGLRHSDERVQQAAVAAILETRLPGRAELLAANLPTFHPQVLENVLGELMFLRDPVCVPALEGLIFADTRTSKTCLLSVQCAATIASPAAEMLLLRVLNDRALDQAVRRAAIAPLARSASSSARLALNTFISTGQNDALAMEVQRALAASGKA